MDTLIPLLLLLVLYLVPELLKRRKKTTEYKYPDIPDKVPQPANMKSAESKAKPIHTPATDFIVETPKTWAASPEPAITMPASVNVPHMTDAGSPWQGKLSPQLIQNGLIFSEIIQPPRAYRPIWRRPK
ncbi:hypothetical protein SPSIL_026130 [Sporomusa silvacetica DSM 10669]|uniref:Uncharacterized protein n=1 Tax=Sporomusa silvacetica DSM 10669 TaxID=1123289 RepID=A0ABZ3IM59_9FIRM|nr:hypothetical protein [Sporomusa silvacetica]OZC23010.1 hypothetical protein SPSIL_03640 [Sporomusa silvacetica DSM 10669]